MAVRILTLSCMAPTALAYTCPAQAAGAIVRMFVEAEDSDGLLRYPYDNEAVPGWYARISNCRSYGAPGRACHAAIHENSPADRRTISQRLPRPLPPGAYRVFLRTVGPRYPDDDTVVRVHLGETPVDFRWREGGKRFVWLPGVTVELSERGRSVSFTAVQFGGNGHGVLYEPLSRSIWIDTLYITGDLSEVVPPDITAERALRAGVSPEELPPRPAYRADDQKTPAPDGPVHAGAIPFAAFDGRRNLWPNSSFELGMNDGWATSARDVKHVFTDADLDRDNPVHGRYSLRIPAGTDPFSRPYHLAEPVEVTLSLYVRGSGTGQVRLMRLVERGEEGHRRNLLDANPVLSMECAAGEQWQRSSVSGKVPSGWLYLSVRSDEQLRIDAVQLERGPLTDYAPRADLEGALRTGQLGNILYDHEAALTAWFHNSGASTKQVRLCYRIVDVRERAVAEGVTEPVTVLPGETVRRELDMLPQLRGMFAASYAVEGRAMPEGETVYLVMPSPADGRTRHELGANTSFSPTELALKARLGLKWTLTCKTREAGSAREHVHPEPDVWNWFDERVAQPRRLGMDLVTCFWPHRVPDFMNRQRPERYRCTRGGYATMPDLKLWGDYVATVGAHYRGKIERWCIDDEAENSWPPDQYAEVVNATLDSLEERVPTVKVGLSGTPEFTEELLRYVDVNRIDFFGGSTLDFDYWHARRVRRLRERYGKPWFCYGVGAREPSSTMYHTLYTYEPVRWKAAWMARRLVNMFLVQDLEVAGHYAGILRNDGKHLGLNKPLCDYDGTPVPWGATFGCLGTLLADAQPAGEVRLGATDRLAYLFRIGDSLGAVTWATCVRDHDHNWKPAIRSVKGLTLPCARGSVDVLDMYWNTRRDAHWQAGKMRLDLDEEPVFFIARSLGRDAFVRMLRTAETPAALLDASFALAPGDDGLVALEITATNNSAADLRDVTLDLRMPEGGPLPRSMAAAWIWQQPVASIGDIAAGEIKRVTLPTLLDGQAPFEDGQIRATFRTADGVEGAVDDVLWLVPAARVTTAPTIDGKLDEWRHGSSAWLFYDWAWARFGRDTVQIYGGGQHFSYPPYSLDAGAAFWTAWDRRNLYVALRLEDDQPILSTEAGESVRLVIGEDTRQTSEVQITPTADAEVKALLTAGDRVRTPLRARAATADTGVDVEVVVPWRALGIRPRSNAVLRFDLLWTDADREDEELVSGTLRWAGDARGPGHLLLTPE